MKTSNIASYVLSVTKELVPQKKIDYNFLAEREVKLIEEMGALAQAVLSEQSIKGSEYKNLSSHDVLEEAVDVFLVAVTISYCYSILHSWSESLMLELNEDDVRDLDYLLNRHKIGTLRVLAMSQFGNYHFETTTLVLYFMIKVYNFSEEDIMEMLDKKIEKWKSKSFI